SSWLSEEAGPVGKSGRACFPCSQDRIAWELSPRIGTRDQPHWAALTSGRSVSPGPAEKVMEAFPAASPEPPLPPSSLRMVPMAQGSGITAGTVVFPESEKCTWKYSLGSARPSPRTWIVTVLLISPGLNVSVEKNGTSSR